MKSALEMYQEVILSHNRNPQNYGALGTDARMHEGYNPICGDKVTIEMNIESQLVTQIAFTAQCCALCRASSSVMTSFLKGKTLDSAAEGISRFEALIRGESVDVNGDLIAFAAIKDFPARAKCVLLPWRTAKVLLSTDSKTTDHSVVSTEI